MNPLGHFFITYLITYLLVPNASEHILLIAFFAVVVDLDHIPGFFTFPKQDKRDYATQVAHFRSFLQEPIGVALELSVILLLWILGLNSTYAAIAAIGFASHWLIDFMTVHTRPFYPFSARLVCLFFRTKESKRVSEAIITSATCALFLLVYLFP